jgi:hypothetical protein
VQNTVLRQRLLTEEAALKEMPLIESGRIRSVMWLHLTYCLIIGALLVLLAIIAWLHVNLRERIRLFVLQQSKLVDSKEIIDAAATNVQ